MRHAPTKDAVIQRIEETNAVIRGIIQYYQMATWINIELTRFTLTIRKTAYKALKQFSAKWVAANQTTNLYKIHKNYTTAIPAISHKERIIGVTSPSFCKWQRPKNKNDKESIYTEEGRNRYLERTGKARKLPRDDIILKQHASKLLEDNRNNLEYYLNRGSR